jgi:hypothetical protein
MMVFIFSAGFVLGYLARRFEEPKASVVARRCPACGMPQGGKR